MPTLAIRNIPEDLMDIMERRAAANGRAVEEEALIWLQSAGSGRAATDQAPARAQPVRASAGAIRRGRFPSGAV